MLALVVMAASEFLGFPHDYYYVCLTYYVTSLTKYSGYKWAEIYFCLFISSFYID